MTSRYVNPHLCRQAIQDGKYVEMEKLDLSRLQRIDQHHWDERSYLAHIPTMATGCQAISYHRSLGVDDVLSALAA